MNFFCSNKQNHFKNLRRKFFHKARRIDEYKLYESKLKNSTTSYGFRLKASRISFYPNAKRFFKVEGDYLPDSFITKELYPKEELEVSFYVTSDRDKYLDFFYLFS